MQIANVAGRVTKKGLMEQAGVGKMKATETLKRLAKMELLEWIGTGTHDPRQHYRANSGK